jgi:hypothetical protein
MRRLDLFSILAALGMCVPTLAAGEATVCPASALHLGTCDYSTNVGQYDITCSNGPAPGGRGYFELAQRTLGVALYNPCTCYHVDAWIRVAEVYRLVGGTPGTPVTFTIRMPVSPTLHVPAFGSPLNATAVATLELDGALVAEASETRSCAFGNCTTTGSLSVPLSAQATIPVGVDFVVVAGLKTYAGGTAGLDPGTQKVEASYLFEGLPPGTSVVPCHDGLTSVLRSSWGSLKLRYR